MALGTDYTDQITSPALTTGSYLLPGTLVVAEVRPNWVTIEGSDGETATVFDAAASAGLGLIGEWVRYSYVLDSTTLQEIAQARLDGNIQTLAASVEVASDAPWRPWVDYWPGDVIYCDLATEGLPAGWYRVEAIAAKFTNEASGLRYVVSIGRAVVPEDAIIADRVAAILEAGLIDLDTGLVTASESGQAATTIIIQSDDIPAHTHAWSELPTRTVGGDLQGTADNATVTAVRQFAHSGDVAPTEGATYVWDDSNETAVWTRIPVAFTYGIPGTLNVGSGTMRLPIPRNMEIVAIRATLDTAPVGASVIFDVNINGTTAYTTQGNRPTIAAAANSASPVTLPDVVLLEDDDYLTIDVDQIGSTTPGDDATIVIYAVATI